MALATGTESKEISSITVTAGTVVLIYKYRFNGYRVDVDNGTTGSLSAPNMTIANGTTITFDILTGNSLPIIADYDGYLLDGEGFYFGFTISTLEDFVPTTANFTEANYFKTLRVSNTTQGTTQDIPFSDFVPTVGVAGTPIYTLNSNQYPVNMVAEGVSYDTGIADGDTVVVSLRSD